MDEEEAAAAGIPAEGTPVRAAAVGGDERRQRVRDGSEFTGGVEEGHQVPPLSRPSQTGTNVFSLFFFFIISRIRDLNMRFPGDSL